jgi:hypothetical protein
MAADHTRRASSGRDAALRHAESLLLTDTSDAQREAWRADLAIAEAAIGRLTAAIAKGGELASLVAALETQERQRQELVARLSATSVPRPTVNVAAVRRTLRGCLTDWRGLLRGNVQQGQQILRRLLVGRSC